MIIHEKNVEFVTESLPEQLPKILFSDLTSFIHEALLNKNINVKRMFRNYYLRNKTGFYFYLKNIVEADFLFILDKYPVFITSYIFRVHTNYYISPSPENASYNAILSNSSNAYFGVNVKYELLWYIIENSLKNKIYHEFIHHLDREKMLRSSNIASAILSNSLTENRKFPPNLAIFLGIFNGIREEGIANFNTEFKKPIIFNTVYFAKLIQIFDDLAENFNPSYLDNPKKLYSEIYDTGILHEVGGMIVAIMAVSELFKNEKKFSAWIRFPNVWDFLTKGEVNAIRIADFFGKKNFSLFFITDDTHTILNSLFERLLKINHLQFLQMYENACKNIVIKIMFLNAHSYHYYATLCIYNYKKSVLGIDDQKTRNQVEKFKARIPKQQ